MNEIKKFFPKELETKVEKVLQFLKNNNIEISFSGQVDYNLCNEFICIPERVYGSELSEEIINQMDLIEKTIYSCIYTRHSNGFVRERHLLNIVKNNYFFYWTFPFILKLSDEYILSIVKIINDNINNYPKVFINNFITSNIENFKKSYSRMISYWNCYYRNNYPILKEYDGYILYNNMINSINTSERIK